MELSENGKTIHTYPSSVEFRAFFNIYKSRLYNGTNDAVHKLEGTTPHNIKIVGTLSSFLAPAAFLISCFYLLDGLVGKSLIGFSICLIFSIPLFLIQYQKQLLAKRFFFVQFLVISFGLPYFIGKDSCAEWIIVLTPCLAYLLFDQARHWLYISIGLGGYFVVLYIYQNHVPLFKSDHPELFRLFLATVIAIFLYWLMVLFQSSSTLSEKKINEQHYSLLNAQKNLEQRNIALQSLNVELQQFAHIASHDMKEPLRTIVSFSALLSRRLRNNPENHEFLSYIEDSAKRMSSMLDDLIVYAKVGVQSTAATSVNLTQIAQNVERSVLLQLEQAGAQLEYSDLPVVLGHPHLLLQLFQNIIGNSLKYRKKTVPPQITLRCAHKEGNIILTFRDNGIGIDSIYLSKIFEPFRRLHTRTEFEGNGIGLATCRKIVEFYGGKIWATSELDAGTAIYVELPGAIVMGRGVEANSPQVSDLAAA